MKTKIGVLVTVPLLVAASAFSQFAVIDVAAIEQLTTQVRTATSTLSQITATYNKITQQYNQAVYMAQYLRNLNNYRMTMTAWQGMVAGNTSGTTVPWLTSINSGLNVSGGWLNSTYARPSFSTLLSVLSAPQKAQAQMQYGMLELQDGTAQSSMQTIGALRLHGAQSEAALNSLEQDSMSVSADQNTTAALLNKINAAGVVNARQAADTNKALVSLAEMQLVQMKAAHDAAASSLENEISARTTGYALLEQQHLGFSEAMQTFRFR